MTFNFTNILRAAFSYQSSLRSFYVLTIWVCNFMAEGFWRPRSMAAWLGSSLARFVLLFSFDSFVRFTSIFDFRSKKYFFPPRKKGHDELVNFKNI